MRTGMIMTVYVPPEVTRVRLRIDGKPSNWIDVTERDEQGRITVEMFEGSTLEYVARGVVTAVWEDGKHIK